MNVPKTQESKLTALELISALTPKELIPVVLKMKLQSIILVAVVLKNGNSKRLKIEKMNSIVWNNIRDFIGCSAVLVMMVTLLPFLVAFPPCSWTNLFQIFRRMDLFFESPPSNLTWIPPPWVDYTLPHRNWTSPFCSRWSSSNPRCLAPVARASVSVFPPRSRAKAYSFVRTRSWIPSSQFSIMYRNHSQDNPLWVCL